MAGVRVVAIMATYNEEDVVSSAIAHLVAEGVSVYVIDHASIDGTRDEVERWRGRGVLGIERFPPRGDAGPFAWARILERKAQLASELDADWFLHQDADEFRESPWPELSLSAAIARVDRLGYNAIDFQVLDFPPTHDGFVKGEDPRQAFLHYEKGKRHDHLQIRGWRRTASPVDLASSGGHEVAFPGRRVFPLRFLLRHYPIRSQAHGERKVFEERRPRVLAEEVARGWHVQYQGLEPGHRFVRDPAELTLYDADEVRLGLMVDNREHEPARQALERRAREAEGHAEVLLQQVAIHRGQAERFGLELDVRNREAIGLHEEIDAARRDAEARRHERDTARRDAEAVRHERDAARQDGEVARREAEALMAGLRERIRELEARLAAAGAEELRVREALSVRAREADEARASLEDLHARLEGRRRDGERLSGELAAARREVSSSDARLADVRQSWSWRLTGPLRALGRALFGR
jgi:hypothetical protein